MYNEKTEKYDTATVCFWGWLDVWQKVYKEKQIRETTATGYSCACRLLQKWLPDKPLNDILEMDLQGLINMLSDIGYSKSQLRTIRTVCFQAFSRAKANRKVDSNPADCLYIPKDAHEKTIYPLSRAQQDEVEKACLNDMHGDKFLFLLHSGLRRHELCNLRWEDYDKEKEIIHVRKSKTDAGVRSLPVTEYLSVLLSMQSKYKHGYIFSTSKGDPLTESSLKKTYLRLREVAGVPMLTNHVCRHTYATRLMEDGVDPKAISALLGHCSVSFTLDRYAGAQLPYLREQLNKVRTKKNS